MIIKITVIAKDIDIEVAISVDLFVCFVALRPKSTAMVMARRSVHLNTLFPGQVNQYVVHILSLVTDNNPF